MNRRVVLWRQRIEHFIFKMFGMFACMNELMMPPKQRRGRGRIGRKEHLGALRAIFPEMWRDLGSADNNVCSSMSMNVRVRLHGLNVNEIP